MFRYRQTKQLNRTVPRPEMKVRFMGNIPKPNEIYHHYSDTAKHYRILHIGGDRKRCCCIQIGVW